MMSELPNCTEVGLEVGLAPAPGLPKPANSLMFSLLTAEKGSLMTVPSAIQSAELVSPPHEMQE